MKQLKHLFITFTAIVCMSTLGCASTTKSEATGEYLDDSVITTKVFKEPTLKSTEINVETYKGNVQLSGFVSSQFEINRAEEVARDVKGVKSIINDMRVK